MNIEHLKDPFLQIAENLGFEGQTKNPVDKILIEALKNKTVNDPIISVTWFF